MNRATRILHLDDNPLDASLVTMALDVQKAGFPVQIHYVQNREQFLAALEREEFDIILSDYRMPDFDGEQALKVARERCPEIPFIMVTGELGEERVIETLKRGATDYVLKDRIFRLVPAIQRALAEAELDRKRREAVEALRLSEERFSAAFRASPDPFVISSIREGSILDVNEAFLRLFGMSRGEIVGKTSLGLGMFVDPHDRERALERLRTAGSLREFETRVRTGSGEERRVMLSAERMNIQGEPALITVMHDVTEQKRAEEALWKSEAKLRAVFHALVEGVVFLNPQGEVEEANDAVQKTHGHTLKELTDPLQDPRQRIIRPDGTPFPVDEQPAILALRTGKAVRNVELGVPVADGTVQWRLVNAQPVYDDRGELLGAVASFFDITDRKRAEGALRESEQRLLATFNNAALGIVEADADGHLLAVNDRICSILGHSREELLRLTVHELTAPEDRDESDRLNTRLVKGKMDSFDYEKRYLRRDGSHVWVHMTVSAVRDADGRLIRAIGTVEDISVRKLAEEKVNEAARFPDENPSPVLRLTNDGTILYANAASSQLLKSWRTGAHGRIPRSVQRLVKQFLRGLADRPVDIVAGQTIYSVLVVPVRDRGYVNLYARDVTEQRRLQKEAEEGTRTLDALMEYIPEGITIASAPDVLIVRTSRYAEELLMQGWHLSEGLSMEQWLARVEHFLADGKTPARVEDLPLWRAVKRGEHVTGEELVLRRPDGGWLSILCNAGPIRDTEGNITGGAVAWRDISDRKQTDAALLESENRYRSLFQDSHAVMLLVDPDSGQIVDANPAAEQFYGWSRQELASMVISQINVLPAQELAAWLGEAKNGRRHPFLSGHRRARGDVRNVEVYSGPVDIHGRRFLHSIIHDVTERRGAEERLLYHVENSPLAVVEWDKDYHVTRWSKEAVRLFGYSSEQVLGRKIDELNLVLPEDIPIVQRTMVRLSGGRDRSVVSENRNLTSDGRIVHCVWHNSVLTDAEGNMSSVMSLVQDVTVERSANASLERMIASLRVLITNSDEHMLLLDNDGAVLCSSRRASAELGYGAKEIEGKTWEAFVPQEQMIHARFFYRDLQRDPNGRLTAALVLVTASGERALFSLSVTRVALGNSPGYLVRVERVSSQATQEMPRAEGLPDLNAPAARNPRG